MIKNVWLQMKTKSRLKIFVASALFIYLLPNALLNAVVTLTGNKIVMYYDDHKVQEKEISNVISVGTNTRRAKRIMWMNGFACSKQTNTVLQFEKNDGWWPTYEGTAWTIEMGLKNGLTSGTKVWIEPND